MTLISGDGALKVGTGPVRTGVTAIFPARPCQFPGRLRRVLRPQRQRRNDGPRLSRRLRDHPGANRSSAIPTRSARSMPGSSNGASKQFRRGDLAGRGRDLERLSERHRRLPRDRRHDDRRARCGEARPGRGRQCRRRDRHGLLRLQRRDRHRVARRLGRRQDLHGRRARPVQHRRPQGAADRRRAGRRGRWRSAGCRASTRSSLPKPKTCRRARPRARRRSAARPGIDHHCRWHRCAA